MEFQDLNCWKESRKLNAMTFKLTKENPAIREEPLKDQLIRAAISTMNNIAEGYGRYSNKEHVRFLDIAVASCIEVESMTYILEDLKCLSPKALHEYREQVVLTKKLIKGYLRYLHNTEKP